MRGTFKTLKVSGNIRMPSYARIEQNRAQLQEIKEFGGSDNELNIRPAFQNCLDGYCRGHREKLGLVPERRDGYQATLNRVDY